MTLLHDLSNAMAKYKGRAIAFFATTMALVFVGLAVAPKRYISDAKLFVRVGRESVTLDPTATTGQVISVYESRESEINSVLELIQSRNLYEQVVDQIGADVILGKPASKLPRQHEAAVAALQKSIKVDRGRKSSVITVATRARTPELAQRITDRFVHAFLANHLFVNRTAGSYEFFLAQSAQAGRELEIAQKELSAAKNSAGLVTIDGQRALIQTKITTSATVMSDAESDLASSEARVAALKTMLSTLPERIKSAENVVPNSVADATRQKLYEYRVREKELLSKYTEFHPDVMAVRQQITTAESQLAGEARERVQSTNTTNPNRLSLELDLLQEQSRAESHRAKSSSLRMQSAQLQQELRDLNDHEGVISQAEKRVELLQTNFDMYNDKLEVARIDQELLHQDISNVNIAQPATLISKPVSPNKQLVMTVGFLVALVGAICVAILSAIISDPNFLRPGSIPGNDGPDGGAMRRPQHGFARPLIAPEAAMAAERN